MNIEVLFGKTLEHLVPLEGTKFLLHKQAHSEFIRLQKDAAVAGFDLQIASGFRDFNRQLGIWNAKARGERTLIDKNEIPLVFSQLSPVEILFAILRWSALPGCSRHHWGTDIDVFNAKTQARDDVKLVPSECEGNGPASSLHEWLDDKIAAGESYGFFRPYATDRDGVAPERWHLSYYPVARRMADHFTFSLFKKNVEENEIVLKNEIIENADEIFRRFVMNFDLP